MSEVLDDFQIVSFWKFLEAPSRQSLIPKGGGPNIILKWQIPSTTPPTQRLNRHPDILLKADGIWDVPSVHSKAHLGLIFPIRSNHLRQARVKRRKFLILFCHLILKIVGTPKVILRACATNGWKLLISVNIKLNLSLSPSTGIIHPPGQISPYILSFSFHIIKDSVNIHVR
jgi:hypothetical protein